jgi:hypothetical protein
MWTIIGITYIFIGQGVMQITSAEIYESPQACFARAIEIMQDEDILDHMACVPYYEKGQDS